MMVACAGCIFILCIVVGLLAYQLYKTKQECDVCMTLVLYLMENSDNVDVQSYYDIKFPNREGF